MADAPKAAVVVPPVVTAPVAVPDVGGTLTVRAPDPPPPPAAAPEKRRWWPLAVGALVVIVVAGLLVFQPWASKGLAVVVESVALGPTVRVLAVNGRIAPLNLVAVKPTVGGKVLEVLVAEGDVVARGDVLARVDASGQQAKVRQAMAGLDTGLVAQSQAQASLDRAEALGDTISRLQLDDARSALQTAMQEVARLTALFDQARIELDKFTILAPIAGTILTRDAEAGQAVDPSDTVFSMADLGKLVVETDVDEAYATQIRLGLPALLQLKGETTRHDGSVSFLAPQVDADTGGLAVKIAFDAAVTAPVGLTVTANIIVDRQDAAITVPRAAIVTDADGSAVFLAVKDVARRRAVTVIDWPAERIEVTEGLMPGDRVITDTAGLSDGMAIIVTGPPDPAAP